MADAEGHPLSPLRSPSLGVYCPVRIRAAVFAALLAAPFSTNANQEPKEEIRLTIELTDGSRIHGEPVAAPALTLKSDGFKVSLDWSRLTGFELDPKTQSMTATFKNGDRVVGVPEFTHLPFLTLIGEMKIPLKALRRGSLLYLTTAPNAPYKIVGAQASGEYAHQKVALAFNGNLGTAWSSGDWKGWIEFDLGVSRGLGEIHFHIQFNPTGSATHEIHVSDEKMNGSPKKESRQIKTFQGVRRDKEALKANCPPGTKGRYILIRCPKSRSWFNIRDVRAFKTKQPAK